MKKTVLVLIFTITSLLSGYSQTKKESIKELFVLMKLDSMMEKTMMTQLPFLLKMQGHSKDSLPDLRNAQDSIRRLLAPFQEIHKKMNEDMVGIYDKHFTESEINYYIDFYKSPFGQKMVNLQPEIQKELMAVSLQKYTREMVKALVEMKQKTKP